MKPSDMKSSTDTIKCPKSCEIFIVEGHPEEIEDQGRVGARQCGIGAFSPARERCESTE